MCVEPLHYGLEAIQILKPHATVKGCRCFVGMVNFLSIFCPDLQKHLRPIHNFTRKDRQFVRDKNNRQHLMRSKLDYKKPPVLHLPNRKRRFYLHSGSSKYATGSALYQIQNGKRELIAFVSKKLPEAEKNYSITELEMCVLAINITNFVHLLKKVDLDAIVDHLALIHILKNKAEPPTTRIKRLLEVLSAYSFNLYYMKGKDILNDFWSRQRTDSNNPHEIMPISFNMQAILKDRYYSVEEQKEESRYLVQIRSQAKSSGTKLSAEHEVDKGINVKPEKQVIKPIMLATNQNHPCKISLD